MKYGRYELKKLKIHKDMSQETECFSAELHLDGRPFAAVSNEGTGGCNNVYPLGSFNHRDIEAVAAEMMKEGVLVSEGDFEPFDTAISSLIAMAEQNKTIAKMMKTKVVWYNEDMDIMSLGYKNKAPVDQRLIEHVAREKPGVVLLNTVEDVAPHIAAAVKVQNEKVREELDAMFNKGSAPRP